MVGYPASLISLLPNECQASLEYWVRDCNQPKYEVLAE